MKEIKSGEYARTEEGEIFRVIEEEVDFYNFQIKKLKPKEIFNPIVKHSFNIIDLIEVGDYVNGEPVEEINEFEITTTTEYLTNPKDIKSIVTKEQFKNIEYKVCEK